MDTNHRGGPVGFVRTYQQDDGTWGIFWPEYSGNRLYQTLGNLQETPRAGLVFPDFDTGDVLYVTGDTEVLIGKDAAAAISRSNLAVKLIVSEARLVEQGLPFRGRLGERSPYNPKVRPLAIEATLHLDEVGKANNTATLLEKISITPSISRFRFSMSNQQIWEPGQWVALDFSEELDIGYSHMRDDDPLSINDDFVRTFTVSSPPRKQKSINQFDITIRRVGAVTGFLFKQKPGFEVPIRGFGGEVAIDQSDSAIVPFVAGGIGITPLLAQLLDLDLERLRIFWTLNINDIGLAGDLAATYPNALKLMSLYITGVTGSLSQNSQEIVERLDAGGAKCAMRRLEASDLESKILGSRWHVCVGVALQKVLLDWLHGKNIIYESFDF